MRFHGCEGEYLGANKEGEELPKDIIRSVIIETPEEERQLRLFLTGALKFDESGCHALGCNIGSNALVINQDVSNGDVPLGTNVPKDADLNLDYSLDEKLRIIDTLTAAIQRNESMMYPHTEGAETKLLALVRSI